NRQFSFERPGNPADDVHVWNSSIDYTPLLKAEIDDALGKHFAATNNFPQTAAEFDNALTRAGLNKETLLRDGWDRPLYVTFRRDARYTDRVQIRSYASFGQQQQEKTEVTPITQHVNYLDLRSAGADGKEGSSDDFDIATFSRVVAEQTSKEKELMPVAIQPTSFSGMTGTIIGTVTDLLGAVLPNATVEAKSNTTNRTYKATSADDGKFYLRTLSVGMYQVTVSAAYFKNTIITDVPVKAGQITQLDLALDVGGVSETVTVMSSAAEATSTTVSQSQITNLPLNGGNPQNFLLLEPGTGGGGAKAATSTPRLREYFPETLVWQPSVETDKQGRAQIRFKLADNITTWKMSVIGSTADGEIGVAEREIQAFQPFFVEHDPPRVLTEGDEIALPVVVRNHLAAPQQVALDIKPEDWFTMLGPTHKQTRVPAGDAVRETFDFRAVASIKEGKQRITAIAGDADDAIERGVHVHPDGAEIAHTAAGIFDDAATLAIDIPADAIPNTARAELKIYPNLLAHVVESVEAIMSRPYGCGEQTISSAYPSLLVLRHYQRAGFAPDKLPPVALRAQRYLRLGYERLLSYRAADGGFSYWGRGEAADLALTAYAVRFLADARELIDVDEDVLTQAHA
ncbi:MAG: carboxypeptidase regulatory-like domain-containing protein, partial [Acidobacteria bacterium]|nr:carboxypeptidase regulatory-like domain-containing protein [Acidobacteriota bacterium]